MPDIPAPSSSRRWPGPARSICATSTTCLISPAVPVPGRAPAAGRGSGADGLVRVGDLLHVCVLAYLSDLVSPNSVMAIHELAARVQ